MPKKNEGLITATIKHEAKQFCLNTGLHGYRFIVLPKRILLERVFWLIIVISSFITVMVLLWVAWADFQEAPTVLVTDSTHHPIWNYVFPAVTICSFNKISKKEAFTLAEELNAPYDISKEELSRQLRLLFQVIYNNNRNIPTRNYTRLQDILDFNGYSVDGVMQRLAPKCEEIIQRCKWKGEEKRCEAIFERIRTAEGYCCAFNYYALKNHTFGGAQASKIPPLPRRVSACGHLTALEVLVNTNVSDYFATQISSIGHRVFIHSPYHFPDWNIQSMLTQKGINHLIGITPSISYSTSSIPDLQVEQRQCLFDNESVLHNFRTYNFHNCMVECRMNVSKRLCGCIPFYFYSESGNYPSTRICNLRDVQCLTENREFLMSTVPGFDFKNVPPDHHWGTEISECDCLPDCDYTKYHAESSSGKFTRKYSTNQLNLFGGVDIVNQSVVRVYFNNVDASRNRRDVIFNWYTLLAYYGGLLGLFIGFSFVSVVELFYFFTIRFVIDLKEKFRSSTENKDDVKVVKVKPHHQESLHFQSTVLRSYPSKLKRRNNDS